MSSQHDDQHASKRSVIMKIIIIGAGLAGLSTAIALRKRLGSKHPDLQIAIYDKTDASSGWADGQGAALGLQDNGLRALESIDVDLRNRVYQAGFPCSHFTFRTDTDYLIGKEYLDVLPVSRPLLIKCLLETLPDDAVIHKTIARIISKQGQKPKVVFEDGDEEAADMIVGADGVRSVVRRSMFAGDERYSPGYQ
jgi:2-polyprenyl-6-methoxyphenol hydroxylase-like FAD-dependent oxidoreductase